MKPKMVKAWAFAVSARNCEPYVYVYMLRSVAASSQRSSAWTDSGFIVGPIVRIEVPAPVKARKAGSK